MIISVNICHFQSEGREVLRASESPTNTLRVQVLKPWGKGDQDARAKGHKASLPPPAHQNYIYMWNNSHWKLTGSWQKDFCVTKTVRKICNWVGRDKKWSGQELCPWEGIQKKREIAPVDTTLGVSRSNQTGCPILRVLGGGDKHP